MNFKEQSDKSIAVKGGVWTSISTVVIMFSQMLRLIILTRFLNKDDFGVVSITNTLITLCVAFTDLGFASVIMYKKEWTIKEFSTLYWMQAIIFACIYMMLVLISPQIASYYKEEILSSLIAISGISLFGQAIGKLYDSILLKAYCFKLIAIRNIITNAVSLVLAIVLAYLGFGAYSLVYSTLLQILLINVWNLYSGIKIQPLGFTLDVRGSYSLVKIGIYQTGTQILDFVSNKLDVFIIGKILGMESLGVYDLAKELVLKFINMIRTVISKVALPLLSNNNNDAEKVKVRFLMITKTVASVCIPICITLAVFSYEVVNIMYGNKFIDATPVVSIFAITTIFGSIASFFDMLGIAKGRTDLNFYQTISRVLITTPIIFVSSFWGIIPIAYGQLLAMLISNTLFWFIVVQHTYPMPFKLYFSYFSKMLFVFGLYGLIFGLIKYSSVFSFFEQWYFNMIIYIIIYAIGFFTIMKYLKLEYEPIFSKLTTKK